jgi:biofilm PGA synthesis N-glycosyltransferase PgaC
MTNRPLSYALVTPARNEAENLRRLAGCLLEQTVEPTAWMVVDDGSTDETAEVARELEGTRDWIRSLSAPSAGGSLIDGRRAGRDIVAFNAGIKALPRIPDIVIKLDADVSMAPDYFERLLAEFAADPQLGMASGACYELEHGIWVQRHVTRSHVRGATRAYRRACLEDVLPLEERLGWDGIDQVKANLRGWKTKSFTNLGFRHHRSMGERDGLRRAWASQGDVAHFLGYRFSYLVLRTLHHARKDPAAVAMLWGYLRRVLRREPPYHDYAVRAYLRREQSLRNLMHRVPEALGRRA